MSMYYFFLLWYVYIRHVELSFGQECFFTDESLVDQMKWISGQCLELQVYLSDAFILQYFWGDWFDCYFCFDFLLLFYLFGEGEYISNHWQSKHGCDSICDYKDCLGVFNVFGYILMVSIDYLIVLSRLEGVQADYCSV